MIFTADVRQGSSTRRLARVTPLVVGGLAAAALAVPSVSAAAFPTDAGRIVVSDGDGTSTSVWPDGARSQHEPLFPEQSKVDSWHAGGGKLIFTDGGNAAYEVHNGSNAITYWQPPGGVPIAGAALSPGGSRVAVTTDTSVLILDGTSSPEVVAETPGGRIAWSAETNEGTLVWDGFGLDSDPGIPGGGDFANPFSNADGSGAGIWMRVDGAAPVEVVTEQSATNPSIAQNGKLLAWEQDGPTGGTDIYYLDPTEVNPVAHHLPNSTTGSDVMPAVSPDGTQIAFVSDATGIQTLRIANVNGQPGSIVRQEPNGVTGVTGVAWQPATKVTAGAVGVTGTPEVGQMLSANPLTAPTGTAPFVDTYAWEACDDGATPTCTQVGVGSFYTVKDSDAGKRLRVVLTTRNAAGTDTEHSSVTQTVPGTDPGADPGTDPGTSAPNVPTLTTFPSAQSNDTTPTFVWTGDAGGRYECFWMEGSPMESQPDPAPCASGLTLPELTGQGLHSFLVHQIDDDNVSGEWNVFTWIVDTEGPAAPTLTAQPSESTLATSATFEFAGVEKAGTVQCRLDPLPEEQDAHSWHTCGSPQTFEDLAVGTHKFQVRELDAAGNRGAVTTWSWTVLPTIPTMPEPTPVEPDPTPVEPDPTPVEPEPTPVKPEPTPVEAEPTPVKPEPTPELAAKDDFKAQAPAVATPEPVATPVKPATVKAPVLVATIGGTKSGAQVGADGGTSSAAIIEVAKEAVSVGCSITGTALRSCKVDLYVAATGAPARAAAVKQVLVGTGASSKTAGAATMRVKVELNQAGKALLRKSPGGLKVSVKIAGRPVSGAPLRVSGSAKLVLGRASATIGGFAEDSAVLTAEAKRQLRALARFGEAATLRCVGHTDASSDDAKYLRTLGERRAKAVCAYLAAHGVKGTRTVATKGSQLPASTNTTKAGRAQNRRVQVTLVR